jgi:hypothetical protein
MKFQEAFKLLSEAYPNDYVALRYELLRHRDGTVKAEITAYAASKGWGGPRSTFVDAMRSMDEHNSSPDGITDDVAEEEVDG